MKRPLGSDDAAEDKSFKMIVYDDHDNKNGATFEYGAKLGLEAFGFSALGWYYTGELIDDFDWKIQLARTLQSYDDLGDITDMTHYWYGGRVGFDAYNIHARAEYIKSMDGLLPRFGYYAEGSYFFSQEDLDFLPIKGFEPFARYGALNVKDHPRLLGEPNTWDRQMITLALLAHIDDYLIMKLEYYLINEKTTWI